MRSGSWLCVGACLAGMANGVVILAQDGVQGCPTGASLDGNVTSVLLIKQVRPQYPGIAKMNFEGGYASVEGVVVMDIVIAPDGSVRDIKVTHGLPQLIESARHAVAQWQYQPARVNGVAIACKTTITVNFKVADPADAAGRAASENGPRGVPPSGVPGVKPVLPPPPEGVLRVSSRAMEGMLLNRIEPVYPPDAVVLNARGMVFLLATVTKTGEVSDVQVISGPDRFRDPAVAAVKQWRFKPYEIDSDPRVVQTTITLNFVPPAQ